MPNYFCHKNCEYCYLGSIKNDPKILDIQKLKRQLKTISHNFSITKIEIFGGEISLLPIDYISKLFNLCNKYTHTSIITNYSNIYFNQFLYNNNISYSISINDERDNNSEVEKLLLNNKYENLSLIQVATPSLLKRTSYEVLSHLNKFNVSNVQFLQYSPALHAKVIYNLTNKNYSDFLKNIIIEYKKGNYNFNISNISDLDLVINKEYDSSMRAVLFINPYNEYCSVDYKDGLEYFKSYGDKLKNWMNGCKINYIKYPKECSVCEYYEKCYAEHIREWNKDDECVGFKSLIEWYRENY
jgi:MoaA/NifB/PqqE/SkfB family radical SAM enzyme